MRDAGFWQSEQIHIRRIYIYEKKNCLYKHRGFYIEIYIITGDKERDINMGFEVSAVNSNAADKKDIKKGLAQKTQETPVSIYDVLKNAESTNLAGVSLFFSEISCHMTPLLPTFGIRIKSGRTCFMTTILSILFSGS